MIRSTTTLIKTVKLMYPVLMFLKDRYFKDGKVYYSEKALIETKKKGKRIAPFVIPMVNGIAMKDEGYRTFEIDAPYIAPKMPITAKELEQKAFGESPESGRTPAERENEVQAEHMDDLRNATLRRHELMCADIITTGKVVMKHFATADDAAKDKNYSLKELCFYENEFGNRYQFSSDFQSMTAEEKILEFYKIASELRKRGVRATDIVMTSDVSMLLMSDLDFLEFFNKAKVEMGDIKPEELPEGVVCNGRVNIDGIVMTMFTYDEVYVDLDGKEKEIFPKGTIAFLHPNLGETVYAQVTFVKDGSFKSYAQPIVPRLVADEGNNLVEVQCFSRPVPYPYDWDGWLVANIYDDVAGVSTASFDDVSDAVATYDGSGESEGESVSNESEGEVTLLTADEINAMTTKQPLIDYAESIGLTGLTTESSLAELRAAILNYQEEKFGTD